ncbi:helix-turn-helix domain-containing protein [Micromonospora sp. CPCC 206060]|uniref:helix-turn-helix domain-containing protein n=1 Tax=Micromonospora sp. CPCC 206060 TaxID=3122406 RepID=UPI002FF20E78
MAADEHRPTSGSTLSERLNRVFDRIRKADGSRFSLREVADAVTAAGEPISFAYIGQLRNGEKDNPSLKHLRGLARFFGVPVEYFTSDTLADEVDRELDLAAALRQVRARTIALRQSVVPEAEQAIDALTELLATIRELERSRTGTDDGTLRT